MKFRTLSRNISRIQNRRRYRVADVQTENGYTKIANELFDKIIQADFNKRELKIILSIIRFTYGFSRKQTPLSIRFISQATGLTFTNVSPVIKKLAANNIIKIPTDYSTGNSPRIISLNKNFDLWTVPKGKNNQDKSYQNDNSTQIDNSYQNDNSKVPKMITFKVPKMITKKEIKENIKKGEGDLNKNIESNKESSEKSNIPLSLLKVSGFVETWETWINYRKESKKKLTVSTREMQLKNLLQWNNSGHDVIQIINNSIMNGWQGLFEPKGVNPVKKAETRNLPDLRELMIKEQNKENKL